MNHLQLFERIVKKRSFLCIGLDSEFKKIPAILKNAVDPVLEFNKRIVDATNQYAVAYKPNLRFNKSKGAKGLKTLNLQEKYKGK
ncbi:MAG TPA: orotidine 5'-phosphate decarboxylase, partial [Bacteroidales bacterium]|nr:orotidine 5'-phosphate decarboxylase [Bacteroidales bacterium]